MKGQRINITVGGKKINPILNDEAKKTPRKTRIDKKHDVKIYVSEKVNDALQLEAWKQIGGSKTKVATEIVLWGLDNVIHYPTVNFEESQYMVHVKLTQEQYQRIGEKALEWRCSVRKAVQRVFIESAKKKQLGGFI